MGWHLSCARAAVVDGSHFELTRRERVFMFKVSYKVAPGKYSCTTWCSRMDWIVYFVLFLMCCCWQSWNFFIYLEGHHLFVLSVICETCKCFHSKLIILFHCWDLLNSTTSYIRDLLTCIQYFFKAQNLLNDEKWGIVLIQLFHIFSSSNIPLHLVKCKKEVLHSNHSFMFKFFFCWWD